jgi:hypothetical protein
MACLTRISPTECSGAPSPSSSATARLCSARTRTRPRGSVLWQAWSNTGSLRRPNVHNMRALTQVLILLVAVQAVACIGTVDAISTVRGHLVDAKGNKVDGCRATVFVTEKSEPYRRDELAIESDFMITLVNAPRSGTGYLMLSCPGFSSKTVTSTFDFRQAASSGIRGVDLGTVVVQRIGPKAWAAGRDVAARTCAAPNCGYR